MESLRRKRKGAKSSSPVESHLSYGFDRPSRTRKKCRGSNPRSDLEKLGSRGVAAPAAVVMTAPPEGRASAGAPGRGLKRKLGCIEPAARIGRKKKLEHEYVLGREIGQGRFGSVRLCRSRVGGEEFACKSLPKNGEESVHREVEIMQHLSGHPGVVMLKGVYEDKECFHLVMELCSGGRLLDQMVKEGRYSEQRAANLIKELVLVIKYCHEMGVVHRDIKPENILLTASGKMKLADFGLAVRVSCGQKLCGVAGSPAYVAPEVLSGNYTEKVDIWGAGVLLHALLVGGLPFQGDSLEAVFEAIKNVELDFRTGLWESISDLARDLISKMLTRDVSTRMTADEILGHPWILFYTESQSKALASNKSRVRSNATLESRSNLVRTEAINCSTSSESSSNKSEEHDDYCFVDALAAAISRVRISEPKRSRLCLPSSPVQQQGSSNMKANLCTAF